MAAGKARVRRAHLDYFTELAEAAAARIQQVRRPRGPWSPNSTASTPSCPTWARRSSSRRKAGSGGGAADRGRLGRYAYLRGRYHEVRQWMDAAVTSYPDAPAGLRAKALLGSGRLALLQCDYAPASRRLEAALRLYRELDEPRGISGALQVLGSVAREQGRYARAQELHTESLAVAEAAGDDWAVASAHSYLAFVSWLQRDFGPASTQAGTALARFRALGDVEGTAWSLISPGRRPLSGRGRTRGGAAAGEPALAEGIGFREGIAWCREQLGLLAATDGDAAVPAAAPQPGTAHRAAGPVADSAWSRTWRRSRWPWDSRGPRPGCSARPKPCGCDRHRDRPVRAGAARPDRPRGPGPRSAQREAEFQAARRRGRLAPVDELVAGLPATRQQLEDGGGPAETNATPEVIDATAEANRGPQRPRGDHSKAPPGAGTPAAGTPFRPETAWRSGGSPPAPCGSTPHQGTRCRHRAARGRAGDRR